MLKFQIVFTVSVLTLLINGIQCKSLPDDTTTQPNTSETEAFLSPVVNIVNIPENGTSMATTPQSKSKTSTTPTGKTEVPLDNLIVDEICSEDPENEGEVHSKSWRKERLMCALLRKMMSQSTTTPKAVHNSTEYDPFPPGYDKQVAPQQPISINGTIVHLPVYVLTLINIRSLRDVDEANEKITLDLDLFLLWVDGLLDVKKKRFSWLRGNVSEIETHLDPLNAKLVDRIWIPDIIFEETVSVARPVVLDKSGKAVLFNKHLGVVVVRTRMLITLHCDMNFRYYPGDTQKCGFHLRSDTLHNREMRLRWWRGLDMRSFGVYLQETSDPNFDYQVADNLKEYEEPTNIGPETRHGKPFSYLWFEIRIRRKMSYHLIQTYLPSVFFLIVTWLCFLIPNKMFEARVGVAMTTLLTQTSMFSSIRESTPVVGYVKAIDIWMVTCIAFIFLALLAFTVGAWIRHERERMRALKANMEERKNRLRNHEHLTRPMRIYKIIERDIEKWTVVSLSLSFAIFVSVYWSWLLVGSEHLEWNTNTTFNNLNDIDWTSGPE